MDEQRLHSRPQDLDPSKCWVIGAAIFQHPTSENRSLLLLQRASHETAFPNAWELPGGHVEQTDDTVAHAVAREVLEETSLTPGVTVQPNLDEQSDRLWVQEGPSHSLYMSAEMKKVVQSAFSFCRAT
ncbi:hypothetical protein BDV40DRAFT_297127 [Aspergillus tamarii]|uniref:Nudix hydrolase domain-containing protein n=1 Tax=Aspergillus tamarii TaxID=41984 RepID=A0A5N6V4Z4_ASPTM|nr:hypothetical protein BDV40DRAFT_297127 [Aspergillus tamarii]